MIKEIEKTMGCTDRNGIARGWIIKYDSKLHWSIHWILWTYINNNYHGYN